MRKWICLISLIAVLWVSYEGYGAEEKVRIFVVSSYHREYLWSQETHQGLCGAMLKNGYLDNKQQIEEFAHKDEIESSKAVIKKKWMDTKRKYSDIELAQATHDIVEAIGEFKPDIVLLGDDNAANYIGNQLLDTEIPVVFWGINGLPTKYGIVDSMEKPNHNITGVWQSGYLKESLDLLHELVPAAKNFAILACDSSTARPKVKELQALDREGELPLKLVDSVMTNSFTEFKQRTLELVGNIDAFFVLNHDTLKDDQGNHVGMMEVGRWYLENIKKPEASHEGQFVKEGMLCAADDSGYNQGYEAFLMAIEILEEGIVPGDMKPRTPGRGPLMVNRERAERLGISLQEHTDIIEEIVEGALALEPQQEKTKIFVVSSYHRKYSWSQQTHQGFCDAMLKFGYFDSEDQITEYTANDFVESSRALIKKVWMDTKRKSTPAQIEEKSEEILRVTRTFDPDFVFLGDDNAANYIGNQFLDTETPVVFWGLNITPLKYGLVETLDKPGHNVTGVYQAGYYAEGMELLKKLVPSAETFAILSIDNVTGRAFYKAIEFLARDGKLPLTLIDTVSVSDFSTWKKRVLQLQKEVDAFFVSPTSGLKDDQGRYVPEKEVSRWYLTHSTIPEVAAARPFVNQGFLCCADDSAYLQGFTAVQIADDILAKGADPATYAPRSPERGALIVNRERAKMLGITLTDDLGTEEYLPEMLDLEENVSQ